MRELHVNGFFVQIMVKYNQEVKTELEALEEALRELKVEILREKARGNNMHYGHYFDPTGTIIAWSVAIMAASTAILLTACAIAVIVTTLRETFGKHP